MENTIRAIILVAATLTTASGCIQDPRSCSVDANSADPAIAACASEDATCVLKTHPECNGETCIRLRGEPGFCSIACKGDADCGEFERCAEVVLASGENYCIPEEDPK